MRKPQSPPHPDLFKQSDMSVAILKLDGDEQRTGLYTYGLDAVVRELSVNVTRTVTADTVDECDVALCSLCSPRDAMALAVGLDHRPKSRLIVGGQGVYPFLAWRHLTHRICFGRCEEAADECIMGESPLSWCYDYDSDPKVRRKYKIRQARKLVRGESSTGCNGRCLFCQYRATRSLFGESKYNPGTRGSGRAFVEDRWQHFPASHGSVTTALDGWSQETRRRVGKPVDDSEIIDKLTWALNRLDGVMRLKVFQIIGYPWETEASLKDDILRMRSLLSRVTSRGNGRIMMMFTNTPFSPEPLTPMEDEPANIETRWRDILLHDDYRCVYDSPHLNAFILPQIPGPLTLYKRVALNRGCDCETLKMIAKAKTIEDAVDAGGSIHVRGAGLRVSDILSKEVRT
jgi:hypothetical protein